MKQVQQAAKHIDIFAKVIFISLVSIAIVLALFYVVLINKAVHNAVAKEKIETEITSLSSELSEKEFAYISGKGEITLDLAESKGFVSAKDKTSFVTLAKPAPSVALR
jgi:cell division protein FtsL